MVSNLVPTRSLGSLDVSVIGLGCNNFGSRIDEAASTAVVNAALDAGINFFDTADVYGSTNSEVFLGRVLQTRSETALVATKFGATTDIVPGGARPEYVRQAAEASLDRLQRDHIDLYQLHTPDPDVPIAETLGALNELVADGLVREIGCSNFSAEQLVEADRATPSGAARFVSVQNQYSLLHRDPESDVLPTCETLGLGFLPYFPLFSGLLTGKYRKGEAPPAGTRVTGNPRWEAHLTDANLDLIERLIAFSHERGFELTDLAFGWLLSRTTVPSVIAGASTPEQVKRNALAVGWTLTPDDLSEVDAILAATR